MRNQRVRGRPVHNFLTANNDVVLGGSVCEVDSELLPGAEESLNRLGIPDDALDGD